MPIKKQITKHPNGARILVKADIGFINEKTPSRFNNQAVYVCVLAETSDGRRAHFARIRCASMYSS